MGRRWEYTGGRGIGMGGIDGSDDDSAGWINFGPVGLDAARGYVSESWYEPAGRDGACDGAVAVILGVVKTSDVRAADADADADAAVGGEVARLVPA